MDAQVQHAMEHDFLIDITTRGRADRKFKRHFCTGPSRAHPLEPPSAPAAGHPSPAAMPRLQRGATAQPEHTGARRRAA